MLTINDRSVKRVKFSENAEDNKASPVFTPLAKSKKSFKKQDINKRILGLWVQLSQEGEYDLLAQRLQEFRLGEQTEALNNFFRKEGPLLLRCGTLHWRNPESLRFICEHVPKDLLQEILRQDNYSNIQGFLLGYTGLEEKALIDEARIKEASEKIKLLVQIDPKGLEEYMNTEDFKHQFTEGVKTHFQKAIEECKLTKHLALSGK